jgi:hypothetical protein
VSDSVRQGEAGALFQSKDARHVMKEVAAYRDSITSDCMGRNYKSPQSSHLQTESDAAPFTLPGCFNKVQGKTGEAVDNGTFLFG